MGPQPGPQTAFCASKASIAIYGGAAGGGKTYGVVLDFARLAAVPGAGGVIFRRTSPELVGAGSVWETARELYESMGARCREAPLDVEFPCGSTIEFHHLQHEKSVHAHQSKQYARIALEEGTHFTSYQFWYLVSRMRTAAAIEPRMRITCNPDPDSFIAELIAWWIDQETGLPIPERSGVLRYFVRDGDDLVWGDDKQELWDRYAHVCDPKTGPMSLTFIAASLADNQALLTNDPGYRARLMSLPRIERERLLGGNWKVRAASGDYFKRGWFEVIDQLPGKPLATIRWWDKAGSEPTTEKPDPDWTRGVKVSLMPDLSFVIEHVESTRARPHGVETLIKNTATSDGIRTKVGLWQDPGQAGVVDIENMMRVLSGFHVVHTAARENKETYAGPVSSRAEAGRIRLLRGPWNEAYLRELESFPKGHDDQVDATSGAFLELSKIEQAAQRGERWKNAANA